MRKLEYLLKIAHPSFITTYPELIILEMNDLGRELLKNNFKDSINNKLSDFLVWEGHDDEDLNMTKHHQVRTYLKNGDEIIVSYRQLKVGDVDLLSVTIIANLVSADTLLTSKKIDHEMDKNLLFSSVFNHSPVGMVLLSSDQVLYKANQYMFDHLGLNYREIIGERFGNAFSCSTVFGSHHLCGTKRTCENCLLRNTIGDVIGENKIAENIELIHEFEMNGVEVKKWFAVSAVPVEFDQSTYALLSFVDISDRVQNEEALRSLSVMDGLTQLNNRRHIIEQLEDLLKHHEKTDVLSVALIDLDNFKGVNETYGHMVGDEVLVLFSELLKLSIKYNDLVGRYDGEEFLLLLPDTKIQGAHELIENLRKSTEVQSSHIMVEPMTFSCGLLQINFDDYDVDSKSILRQVDHFLYEAKANGKNCTKSGLYEYSPT